MSGSTEPILAPHLRPVNLLLVFLGGAVGVVARYALMAAIPDLAGVPLAIMTANVCGALLLGVLFEFLTRKGPESKARGAMRLLFGTGLLGGFTTYSALALGVAQLGDAGQWWLAAGYGLATVVCGGLASWLGIWCGGALAQSMRPQPTARRESAASSDGATLPAAASEEGRAPRASNGAQGLEEDR